MTIESLLTAKVIEAVKQCYGAEVTEKDVQLQATRKDFAGDLTVVVFPFTRHSHKSPEETGKELGEYLKRNIDEIRDYNVIKGFLNIVISSATAAGYGDFCHQLQHNSGGFFFYTELFPALMQGNQVEESVLAALDRINARINEFDVVVIIRGGGATSDLSGFDTYLLAAACAQFPLPIITGIGHERDDTVLDSVAHTRVKTPTAAAELLIHQVAEVAEHLEELSMRIQQGAYMLLDLERRRLETLQTRIPNLVHRKLADARFSLLAAKKDLSQVTKALVARQSHRLELLQQRIADASPDKLLSRGYSITIKDGKAVTDASSLKPGEHLITRLSKGEVRTVVEK